jgi:hypothetical protein
MRVRRCRTGLYSRRSPSPEDPASGMGGRQVRAYASVATERSMVGRFTDGQSGATPLGVLRGRRPMDGVGALIERRRQFILGTIIILRGREHVRQKVVESTLQHVSVANPQGRCSVYDSSRGEPGSVAGSSSLSPSHGTGTKRSAVVFRNISSMRSRWAATDAETTGSNSSIARR